MPHILYSIIYYIIIYYIIYPCQISYVCVCILKIYTEIKKYIISNYILYNNMLIMIYYIIVYHILHIVYF